MKPPSGVDADPGLVHTVRCTSGHVGDVVEARDSLHGQEVDAGCRGAAKRPDTKADVRWHIARKALDETGTVDALIDRLEKLEAGSRAKVEYPLRVIERQLRHVKVRYRGLSKNTAQLFTLFALSNLWMVRANLLEMQA